MADSKFNDVSITGVASQSQPASLPEHLVRLDQVSEIASGLAPLDHTHTLDEVTDFDAELPAKLAGVLTSERTIRFTLNGTTLDLRVLLGEGLVLDSDGVAVDFASGVARLNHTHAQLHDPATGLATGSMTISVSGQVVRGDLKLAQLGGLRIYAAPDSGVGADFGSGVNQVARGNHSHEEFHDPVTVVDTETLQLFIDGQILSGTVRLTDDAGADRAAVRPSVVGLYIPLGTGAKEAAAGDHTHAAATSSADGFMSSADKAFVEAFLTGDTGAVLVETSSMRFHVNGETIESHVRLGAGMTLDPGGVAIKLSLNGGLRINPSPDSGVGVDWGSGINNVPRGNHSHEQLHDPVEVVESDTLILYCGDDQVLSGTVRLPGESAGAGRTPVRKALTGLYVKLGTTSDDAAAGDHVHAVATSGVDGFMSMEDKLAHDRLVGAEQHAAFTKHDAPVELGDYVGGRIRFRGVTRLTEVNLTGVAPVLPQWFTLEIGGADSEHTVMLSGVPGEETHVQQDIDFELPLVDDERTDYIRWRCSSGVQSLPEEGATRLSLATSWRTVVD